MRNLVTVLLLSLGLLSYYPRQSTFYQNEIACLESQIDDLHKNIDVLNKRQKILKKTFIFPVKYGILSSQRGYRKAFGSFHEGIDVFAYGDIVPVQAAHNGRAKVLYQKGGYGKYIIITSLTGDYSTRYAHLSDYLIEDGQIVKKGQDIGYMGNTGRSTSKHLHYEVEVMGVKIDPLNVPHATFRL